VTQSIAAPPDPRAEGVRNATVRVVLVAIAVALIFSVSGAATWVQKAEWLVESVMGALVGLVAARRLVPISWYRNRLWAAALLIAAVVTVPIAAFVLFCVGALNHIPVTWKVVRTVIPSVFGTSVVMTALAFLVRPHATATHAAPAGAAPVKFLARVPPKLQGAELYAVEADDHYLRLHTSVGQDLILMRLGDAIDELDGLEGAQTHRSWWVAKSAVTSVERFDGRAALTLKDGAEVPVSRGFARALRAAGWL
jgi:DNA-binding LytR/AlgR family response regulator